MSVIYRALRRARRDELRGGEQQEGGSEEAPAGKGSVARLAWRERARILGDRAA